MSNDQSAKVDKLVSVIVPIYMVEKYLEKCIESIIFQTYKNLEIILVDDGSKDSCAFICDKYSRIDNRIYVIHKENGGLVSARKVGVSFAHGEYAVYVDGDDWIEENYIERFMIFANTENYDIVWSLTSYREYDGNAKLVGYLDYDDEDLKNDKLQIELARKVSGIYGFQNEISYTLCMKCFRLSFLREIQNSVDDKISYDEDFCCTVRGLALNPAIRFVRNSGYYYVQRDDSINHEQSTLDKNLIMLQDTLAYLQSDFVKNERLIKLVKKQYQLSQIYHGGIDRIQDNDCEDIIPFVNAKKNKKIILYGMGTTGHSILSYFLKSNIVEVIGYLDERNQGNIDGVRFLKLNDIDKYEYDYVLISAVKICFINEIMKNLVNQGIDEERIAFVDFVL